MAGLSAYGKVHFHIMDLGRLRRFIKKLTAASKIRYTEKRYSRKKGEKNEEENPFYCSRFGDESLATPAALGSKRNTLPNPIHQLFDLF
jgi:hypothetical protein